MKIALIGNYGAGNIGDNAILTALLNEFSAHSVTVFSADPSATRTQFGVKTASLFPLGFRSFLKRRFYQSFKSLKEAELVVLGGGGLFQDNRLYACFIWAWQLFWVKFLKKPLFIYATGVGPLSTRMGKSLTQWAYRLASVMTVRDAYSYDLLVKLKLPKSKLHLTADPVFTYKMIEVKESSRKKYLISLRPWLHYNADLVNHFAKTLKKHATNANIELVFVVMQGSKEADTNLIEMVQKETGGRIFSPSHFTELLYEMKHARLAVGMRYHFLIAAMMSGTPCLPVSYSPKIDELFRGTPLWPYLLSVEHCTAKKLTEHLEKVINDSNEIEKHLKIRADYLKQQSYKNEFIFRDFLKTFDRKDSEW